MSDTVDFNYIVLDPKDFKPYRYCGRINLKWFCKLVGEGKSPEFALGKARTDLYDKPVDVEDEQDRYALLGR